MPEQLKQQFTWNYWFTAALVPGLLILIVSLVQLKLGFDSHETINVSKDIIKSKSDALGPMKKIEWAALMSVLMMATGLVLSSKFNIQPTWLGFAILVALMSVGFINNDKFKKNINWPFLFYLGGMVGIMQSFQYLGMDTWILSHITWLVEIIGSNPYIFILVSYVFAFLASFLFGTAAAPAIAYTILSPLAGNIHFNAWLLAFILLMATESWFFPYQSSYYLCFEEMTNQYELVNHRHILKQNAIFVTFRLLIIFSSVWYWRQLGIL
jgi:DASS family divalent anion:Na+ symporter